MWGSYWVVFICALELNVGLIDQVNFLKHMSSLKGCSLAQVWVKVLGDMVVSESVFVEENQNVCFVEISMINQMLLVLTKLLSSMLDSRFLHISFSVRYIHMMLLKSGFLFAYIYSLFWCYSITVMFFAKEDADFNLIATKESLLSPVKVPFDKGLGQKFRQPCGTGIDFSLFEEIGLTKEEDAEVYPLVVKAEAHTTNDGERESDGNSAGNSQITQAVFEKKENGEYKVRVMKQILWVDNMRYELQEIYGIGNAVEGEQNDNEAGKECIICLSEPRDTTVLPCRHMVRGDFTSSFLFYFLPLECTLLVEKKSHFS